MLDRKPYGLLLSTVLFLLAVGLFLLAIELVSGSVLILGKESVESILLVTSNPFIGLFIGLLATALIQSSSTVTAMTVAIVASGSLSLANAIPIVMGANIGTTLTSTLVSLSFITNRNEFRKAISAGTIHDFFNIFTALIVFPLEYYYGALSFCATQLTSLFGVSGNSSGFLNENVEGGYSRITDFLLSVLPENIITLAIGLVLLFISIKFLSTIIYSQLIGPSKDRLKKYVFNDPYRSFGWGTLITAGVQSSSITTSLIVPLVASGKVKLNNAFPFIMGANIGTTITALLAAFNRSEAAISLAFVHLLFNLIGVLIFLPFPMIRKIPVLIAYRFGTLTFDSRLFGFSYIIVSFFLLPFTLIYFSRNTPDEESIGYEIKSPEAVYNRRTSLFELKENDLQAADFFAAEENTMMSPLGYSHVEVDELLFWVTEKPAASR
ncbi:MAG: Na/Pi cotransporter family protein [Roseivirga sp.]